MQELGNRADHFKRLLRRRQAKGKVQVLPLTKKTEDVKPEVDPRSPDKNICFENPREKATSKLTSGFRRSQAVKIGNGNGNGNDFILRG